MATKDFGANPTLALHGVSKGYVDPTVGSVGTTASLSINTDTYRVYKVTALVVTMSITVTGTPYEDQELKVAITSAAQQQLIWDSAKFQRSGTVDLPSFTPGSSRKMTAKFWYDPDVSRWVIFALDAYGY